MTDNVMSKVVALEEATYNWRCTLACGHVRYHPYDFDRQGVQKPAPKRLKCYSCTNVLRKLLYASRGAS